MGRPKTPLDQLDPRSVAKHKGRIEARLASPKPRGVLGRPSLWLTAAEKKIWKKLVKDAPAQLGESDRCLLEITVTLKAKLEDHTIENAQVTQLISCLSKLGMIPADRRPTADPKKKEEDPVDEFVTDASKEA
jgi:hypothetical protein